jgi:hypothetical protein
LELDITKNGGKNLTINYTTADFKQDIPFIFGCQELIKPGSKKFVESIRTILNGYKEWLCMLRECEDLPRNFREKLVMLADEHNAKFK